MKRLTIVVLSALLLVCLCGCAVQTYSTYENEGKYTAASSASLSEKIDGIKICWVSGSVKIETYDGETVKFAETSSLDKQNDSIGEATENKTLNESLKMRYLVSDGILCIQFCRSGLKVRSSAVAELEKELTVYVPAGGGLRSIDAELVSADLYIKGVKADLIKCDNMSSECRFIDCTADEITVNTMSGNTAVNVKDTIKSMKLDSMSGDLTVDADGIGELLVNGMSADITLNLKKADFTLSMTGLSMSLEANGINYEKTEEKTYKFGDGSGKITVNGQSGKVSVTVK